MADLRIIWYGHGTTKIETPKGLKILVDPFLSGNPACPPSLKNDRSIDLLLLTHGHADHFGDTLSLLNETNAIVMCIFEMKNYLISKGIPDDRIIGFNIGGTAEFGGVSFTMTNALHSGTFHDGQKTVDLGPPVGYVVTIEDDRKIYFAGDTDIFSEMEFIGEFHKPILSVLPIDGYYNMGPRAAARAVQLLQSEQVMPIHHSTFPILWGKPKMLRDELDKLGLNDVKMHKISPGTVIEL